MSMEARALLLVTAVLVVFGLAVLYSASALQAISANSPGHFFVLRQFTGVVAGVVTFAICAKIDAEIWRRYAWPIMGISLLLMLVVILPSTEVISGSRRYLFNGSLQPSELATFAVLVWTPMLRVKKGPCAPLKLSSMPSRPATGMTCTRVMWGGSGEVMISIVSQ